MRALLAQTLQAERAAMRQEFTQQMQDLQMRTALAEREAAVSRTLLTDMAQARSTATPGKDDLRELRSVVGVGLLGELEVF